MEISETYFRTKDSELMAREASMTLWSEAQSRFSASRKSRSTSISRVDASPVISKFMSTG